MEILPKKSDAIGTGPGRACTSNSPICKKKKDMENNKVNHNNVTRVPGGLCNWLTQDTKRSADYSCDFVSWNPYNINPIYKLLFAFLAHCSLTSLYFSLLHRA